ncbi:MAG TPA: 3-carboxy-cis,cis-muconate cycloisomerase [Casimicrobiaceae bacterium]|jgi:3-carboxy-cis,cis-muconate cycloisomerase
MPSTLIDSTILGNLVGTEAMRALFSDDARTQRYLDVEAALARVQGRLGIIPEAAAAEIERNCHVDRVDMAKLRNQTERAGSPILGVVAQLTALCAEPHGRYCHWGATTQDITDTATVLQMRDALALIDADLGAIANALADLALRYRDTPMAGRSHLQQAAPVTFGYKAACLLSAIERHRARLAEIRPRALTGELGGAVGTLASLGKDGLKVRAALMRELDLADPDISWHTQRDCIAEVGCLLGLITGTLGKLGIDTRLLMQTEVAEVAEPFAPGRGASSTMPQKRNPISSVYLHACAAVVRQQVALLLEAMVADHERASGPWHIEWIALPEAFVLTSGALAHARGIVEGLQVDPGRMRDNLDLTHGLVMAEAVMMGLAPHLGRERAHHLIDELCRAAIARRRPLLDLLAETPEVTAHLDRQHLAALCDPANYLGLAGEMIDRVVGARSKR